MDGKPLYEYARANIPLPRAIPSRQVSVSIKLLDFTPASTSSGDGGHEYRWPERTLSEEEKGVFRRLTELVHDSQVGASSATETPLPSIGAELPETSAKTGLRPATFKVRMTVSGGTYVRSIVHDLGVALGCQAHVVLLRRTRQGQFVLRGDDTPEVYSVGGPSGSSGSSDKVADDEEAMMNSVGSSSAMKEVEGKSSSTSVCIPWSVWETAMAERKQMLVDEQREKEEMMASGASPQEIKDRFSEEALRDRRMKRPEMQWEKEILRKFVEVEVPVPGGHGHDR